MRRYRPSRKRQPIMDNLVYEKDFQATLCSGANLFDWLWYHTYDSRRSPFGFPDLNILGYEQLLVWEVKSENGEVSPAQQRWIDEYKRVQRVRADIVRPSDLDACLDILKAKGGK